MLRQIQGGVLPKFSLNRWTIGLLALVCLQTLASFTLRAFPQTLAGDTCSILITSALFYACLRNFSLTRGPTRTFWELMAFGAFLWVFAQLLWWEWEITRRQPVPPVFLGNVFMFLGNIPFMAAMAVQPNREWKREPRRGALDFSLILFWWIYIYLFSVIPWWYVSYDAVHYARNLLVLRLFQAAVLVSGAFILYLRTHNRWRKAYRLFFFAYLVSAVIAIILNMPAVQKHYRSGSFYDIFFTCAVGFLTWTCLKTRKLEPWTDKREPQSAAPNLLLSRLAIAAVLSIPCLALWELFAEQDPPEVRWFRLKISMLAIFVLTSLVFLKQYLMNLELAHSLQDSEKAIHNLRTVQDEMVQTEKLASLGRLVAGAAHEINNPLTAILGYSELLAITETASEQQKMIAQKIRHQARRTKALVSNLLSFARQGPTSKAPLDLNSVLSSAVQLRELDLLGQDIHIVRKLEPGLPPIYGDEYQLLQVCLHILNNAVDALSEASRGSIVVSSGILGNYLFAEFRDTGTGVREPQKIFDPFYTTKSIGQGMGLSLSASYGIVQEHGGEIICGNGENGGAVFTITLPMPQQKTMEVAEPSLTLIQ